MGLFHHGPSLMTKDSNQHHSQYRHNHGLYLPCYFLVHFMVVYICYPWNELQLMDFDESLNESLVLVVNIVHNYLKIQFVVSPLQEINETFCVTYIVASLFEYRNHLLINKANH